ncbi:hypothetical protein V8G54_005924 [Vigna mungo]|uniref:Uncharacterized protein n=1 Tax=Vigna mungo TaxID=3915 RepID=A0AAQ3S5Y8_VIGMU
MFWRVAEPPPDVRGVTDDQNSNDDRQCSAQDKWSPAAEPAGAAVAQVAHQGLHQQPRERPTQPYDAGPHVWDPQLLHVRRQKRELQCPPKLNASGNRRYPQQQPQRNPSRDHRSTLGPALLTGTALLSFLIRHCVRIPNSVTLLSPSLVCSQSRCDRFLRA